MLIVYVDTDTQMHERIAESFYQQPHNVVSFSELFEAYKWIKRNEIPDVIVTEMDVESSTGLQALKFLLTKAKLKQTRIVGYANAGVDRYSDLAMAEGASTLLAKTELPDQLAAYVKRISAPAPKAKTLRDVEKARGKTPAVKPEAAVQRTPK
ncbi:MAG TPA: response regulator [Chitinophagales bacterium]|nr:response regulator [Chitinophagales bacterium]